MRLVVTMFVSLALTLSALAAGAGPLMGVIADRPEMESGEIGSVWSLGYATFNFRNLADEIRATGVLNSSSAWHSEAGGVLATGELYKYTRPDSDAMVRFGGWFSAPLEADGPQSGEALGELHLGYRFDESVGLEVGTYLADARDIIGREFFHATYDVPRNPANNIAVQLGAGTAGKTDSFLMAGAPRMETRTYLSVYANASYPMKDDVTVNAGLWFMRQRYYMREFSARTPYGLATVEPKTSIRNVVNWFISVGKEF